MVRHKVHNRHRREILGKVDYTGKSAIPTDIHFVQYNESSFIDKKTNKIQEILPLTKEGFTTWIQVTGMSDPDLIIALIKDLGLNTMYVKDILTAQHITTVEEYDEDICVILPAIYYNEKDKINKEHLALIIGKDYVISFQESDYPLFESVYTAIKDNSLKIRTKKADFLLATILNEVVYNYTDCISQLEEALEDLEDQLLDVNKLKNDLIAEIQEKRREVISLRKLLLPIKDQFIKLIRTDSELIQKNMTHYYKDIYDQLLYVLQSIESCREIMSSLVDLYLSNNDLKMNIVMKRLTVVATIFIPLTFVVGLWGMNFDYMPELHYRYGYLFAWLIMIIIGLSVWWYLKKKDWF